MAENSVIYELLAKQFKSSQEVITEIINLQAILNLPKGTEHFLSDLHGESETFLHILKNASGVIRTKIDLVFGDTLSESEKNNFATLIYYPKRKLEIVRETESDIKEWYRINLFRLLDVAKLVASKYTRSKVRKALPEEYRYIMDELLNMSHYSINRTDYYNNIVLSIIELNNAEKFIIALCELIQRLAVDHLHIVGDIYDRGNGADKIMDMLIDYHSLDIEWGNHDILWIGAYLGNAACICNIIRINCVYRNLQVLESGYGINLRPLVTFALEEYKDDPCSAFSISDIYGKEDDFEKNELLAKMTKAVTVIQLKIENALIRRHPEFNMDERILYKNDVLTPKESALMNILSHEFTDNKRLKTHINFLINNGSMYLCFNGNLLMHGCIPTEEDGTFSPVAVGSRIYSGKALYDRLDELIRRAYIEKDQYSVDYIWYLWCGKKSPLYGRDKMCVYTKYFENYTETESKDPYYKYVKNEDYCLKVLKEFGLTGEYSHIVNGHMPVRVINGETPESANCRHITIDGGLAKAYHEKTGIGGYTLISNSQGLYLASHSPFTSAEDVVKNSSDLRSNVRTLQEYDHRILVRETDKGRDMIKQIELLKKMLKEYYKEY